MRSLCRRVDRQLRSNEWVACSLDPHLLDGDHFRVVIEHEVKLKEDVVELKDA